MSKNTSTDKTVELFVSAQIAPVGEAVVDVAHQKSLFDKQVEPVTPPVVGNSRSVEYATNLKDTEKETGSTLQEKETRVFPENDKPTASLHKPFETPTNQLDNRYPTLPSAVNELFAKRLDAIVSTINQAILETSARVRFGKDAVNEIATISKESINDNIDSLKEFAKSSVETTKNLTADIKECMLQKSSLKLNVRAIFAKCKMPLLFYYIDSELRNMENIKNSLAQGIEQCTFVKDVNGCMEVKIQEIEERMLMIGVNVDSLLLVAIDSSTKCTTQTFKRLETVVKLAEKEFTTCTLNNS